MMGTPGVSLTGSTQLCGHRMLGLPSGSSVPGAMGPRASREGREANNVRRIGTSDDQW
jgi:hypothetical protein